MDPHRKPRADSPLKTLLPERQAELVEYARTHTVRATAEWLTRQGVPVACSQVSRFLQWHTTRQQIENNHGAWQTLQDELRHATPLINDRELNAFGQRHFALNAIQQNDLRGFVALRKLALAGEIHELSTVTACQKDLPASKAGENDQALTEDKKTPLFTEKVYGRPPEPAQAPKKTVFDNQI